MASQLGSFLLDAPLARGGMGEVWSGHHVTTGQPVAVKVMDSEWRGDRRMLTALQAEVRAISTLAHPGIVSVLDQGEVPEGAAGLPPGTPYLVMERIDGGDLKAHVGRTGWRRLRRWLDALLAALGHAHARGLLHRDLKPDNVLLTVDDEVRLTDFGLAHVLHDVDQPWDASFVTGTPAYMAPEQMDGAWRTYGPPTDLFALGRLAWAMVSGGPPLVRGGIAELMLLPRPVFEPVVPVPEGLDTWLYTLMAADPRSRFQRAADARLALSALGDAPDPPPREDDPPGEEATDASAGEGASSTSAATRVREEAAASVLTGEEAQGTTMRKVPPKGGALAPGALPAPPPLERPPCPPAPPSPAVGRTLLRDAGLGLVGLRQAPLVGREATQASLWSALESADREGGAAAVVLRGPAGVGKSRLAEWLCESAHAAGVAETLVVRHDAAGSAASGLGPALARRLRAHGLRPSELVGHARQVLATETPVPDEDAVALASLLSPEAPPEDDVPAVVFRRPRERHVLLARALARLARRRVAVLWLDDGQWGLDALEFARFVLDEGLGVPCLLVVTIRDEGLGERPQAEAALSSLLERGDVTELRVAPLGDAARTELVEGLLGLRDDLAEELIERSGGNPLFAVSLVEDWARRGVLERTGDGYRKRPGAETALPPDLASVWQARLVAATAELDEDARRLLQLAAVLGETVEVVEWEGAARALGASLDPSAYRAEGLAEVFGPTESGDWRFVHGVAREALEALAREAGHAAELHRAAATMLEAWPGTDAASRRGRHLLAAGDVEVAFDPLWKAAAGRSQEGANARARGLVDHTLARLEAAGIGSEDPRPARLRILGHRLDRHAGALGVAIEGLEEIVALAERHGWTEVEITARRELAETLENFGRLKASREMVEAALALVDEATTDKERTLTQVLAAMIRLRTGDMESARELVIVGRAGWEAIGDPAGIAVCENILTNLALIEGRFDEATAHAMAARAAAQRGGFRLGEGDAETGLGESARGRGDLATALDHFERAARIYAAVGSPLVHLIELNLTMVDLVAGRPKEALERAEGLLGLPVLQRFVIAHRSVMVAAAVQLGDREQAEALAEALLEVMGGDAAFDDESRDFLGRAVAAFREAGDDGWADRLEAALAAL